MVWTAEQTIKFQNCIRAYDFPKVYFDFDNKIEIKASSIAELENVIRGQLLSESIAAIKCGLANIVYWGNAQAGYRDTRVRKFLEGVSEDQLLAFRKLITEGTEPSLSQLKSLGLPQFSAISFLSKITTFLNPNNSCVLDLQIARLKKPDSVKALANLKQWTSIPVTESNQRVYQAWCNECRQISDTYFNGRYRTVDIERGFFHLIQNPDKNPAKGIDCARVMYEAA